MAKSSWDHFGDTAISEPALLLETNGRVKGKMMIHIYKKRPVSRYVQDEAWTTWYEIVKKREPFNLDLHHQQFFKLIWAIQCLKVEIKVLVFPLLICFVVRVWGVGTSSSFE